MTVDIGEFMQVDFSLFREAIDTEWGTVYFVLVTDECFAAHAFVFLHCKHHNAASLSSRSGFADGSSVVASQQALRVADDGLKNTR